MSSYWLTVLLSKVRKSTQARSIHFEMHEASQAVTIPREPAYRAQVQMITGGDASRRRRMDAFQGGLKGLSSLTTEIAWQQRPIV